jgi:hypothetical protein
MSENALPVAPVKNIVHTPGPWRVIEGRDSADNRFSVRSKSGENITGWGCVQQLEGNARLIAAAPELLAHLRHMIWLVEIELKEDGGHILAGARAAVDKATSVV